METSGEQSARDKLESSKNRLASAFGHLEQAIDQRLRQSSNISEVQRSTAELTANLKQLAANHASLKEVSGTVLKQLSSAIQHTETLLKQNQGS